jgi:hypothetical protein
MQGTMGELKNNGILMLPELLEVTCNLPTVVNPSPPAFKTGFQKQKWFSTPARITQQACWAQPCL